MIKKEAEKNLKYKDLITEIQSMWNVKAILTTVVRGRMEPFQKSFRKYLSNITGNYEIQELQKQPYWTLDTYCGNVNVKVQNIFKREITLHVAQIVNTEQLQHYIP